MAVYLYYFQYNLHMYDLRMFTYSLSSIHVSVSVVICLFNNKMIVILLIFT
jgi:hypothetical protein